jgi:REP element-mobilizing transposase RayT
MCIGMPSQRINKNLNEGTYFLTMTVFRWYYIFDRFERWDILAHSLNYCIEEKGIDLVAFVFMLNHLHLIITSKDVAGFVRDFKKYTSKELKKNIKSTESHILKLFTFRSGTYQFWQKTNMPKYIETEDFFRQKLDYIHDNPVVKNYVMKPEDWYWSSANPQCELKAKRSEW